MSDILPNRVSPTRSDQLEAWQITPIVEDVDSWFRLGRGHRFEFYATDYEVQAWLLAILPAEYAPYRLVGGGFDKGGQDLCREPVQLRGCLVSTTQAGCG